MILLCIQAGLMVALIVVLVLKIRLDKNILFRREWDLRQEELEE